MRKIYYTRDTGKSGRQEYFAKISQADRDFYIKNLSRAIRDINEHSTVPDSELWQTVTTVDRYWGKGQRFEKWRPQTMLSVMAGLLEKLQEGGDFTEKQVANSERVFHALEQLIKMGVWKPKEKYPVEPVVLEEDLRQDQKTKIRAKLFSE